MRDRYWIDSHYLGIFTKKLDETEPELFYNGNKTQEASFGKVLKPFLNERCLLSLKLKTLTIIKIKEDLTPDEVRIIPRGGKWSNSDFAVFGNRVLILSSDSQLSFFQVIILGRRIRIKLLNYLYVEGVEEREEYSYLLSVCSKGRFVIIVQGDINKNCSSLVSYEIVHGRLVKKHVLDIQNLKEFSFGGIQFVGYFGNLIIFSVFLWNEEMKKLLTFCYDQINEEVREIEELREDMQLANISKFVDRRDGTFGGIDWKGRTFSINYI